MDERRCPEPVSNIRRMGWEAVRCSCKYPRYYDIRYVIFLVLESTLILFEPLQCTGFYGVIVETRAFSHCTPASPMIIFIKKWLQFNENIAISNNLVHFTRNHVASVKLTTENTDLGDHRENAADGKRSRQRLSLYLLFIIVFIWQNVISYVYIGILQSRMGRSFDPHVSLWLR